MTYRFLEQEYNEFKIHNSKKYAEETLNQLAMKTTIQILYDEGLPDIFPNADKVFKQLCLLQGVDLT